METVIHLKWDEPQNKYVDCGIADKIGVGTIMSVDVDVFQCRECKLEFDASWHESYRVEEDPRELNWLPKRLEDGVTGFMCHSISQPVNHADYDSHVIHDVGARGYRFAVMYDRVIYHNPYPEESE